MHASLMSLSPRSAKLLCLLQVPPSCSQVSFTPDPLMAAPATMLLQLSPSRVGQCVELSAGCAWLPLRLEVLASKTAVLGISEQRALTEAKLWARGSP